MKNQTTISVIIATYNRSEDLKNVLDCLQKQELPDHLDYEVLIIDNNSSDNTKSVVEAFFSSFQGRLRYFFEPQQGKPFAINRGIEEAKGEIVVLTDDDCTFEGNYLANVYKAFNEAGPSIGFIGGPIMPRWVNCNKPKWFDNINPDWLKEFFWGPLAVLDYGDKSFITNKDLYVSLGKKLFYGANMAVRKELFLKYGGLNLERTVTEDMEFQLRFLKEGVQGLYAPQAKVYHKVPAGRLTPGYYYGWYYVRGTFMDIEEKYKIRFHHPLGIPIRLIQATLKFFIASLSAKSFIDKMHMRCRGIFNIGQMVQIARRSKAKVSIIIPTYNRADSIKDTLRRLQNQYTNCEFDYEVIVVDNNSKDDTRRVVQSYARRFWPWRKLRYYFQSHQGRVFALNLGIRKATGDIIACLDDDCAVDRYYVLNIYEAFRRAGPEIGFIGGKILPLWLGDRIPDWLKEFLPGSPERSKNSEGINEFFCGPLGILDYGDQPFVIQYNPSGEYRKLFYGANISFRKSLFERFGYFSSDSVLVEDTEMCQRLLNAGVKALYDPTIRVYHKIKTQEVTPDHYYRYCFTKGMRREIVEPVDDKFCSDSWDIFKRSFSANTMKDMLLDRYKALFNFGQMIKHGDMKFEQRKSMKILYVLAFKPIRIFYGSELRNRRFVEFLRTKGELDLLTLERLSENTDMEYIRQNFRQHHAIDALGKPISSWKRFVHQLPWQLGQLYNDDAQKAILKIVEENDYDLIFISKLYPVKYFVDLPEKWQKKVVMDFDDILSDLYRNNYKDFINSQKNSFFLRLYEHRALKRFKRVFICSNNALRKISPKYRQKAGIISNVYEIKSDRFFKPGEDPNELLFVGSLDYFPNLEGLKWFLKTIWPEVKKQFTNLKLTVIGKTWKNLDDVCNQLGNWPDVEIAVNVDSVVPYYQKCFASIVPLMDGSGTRVKILESCSFGRPVLTTQKGMEGLEFKDKKEIFLFKDAATFMEAYQQLLTDGTYAQVAHDAFKIMQEKYSPRNFEAQMKYNWEQITSVNGAKDG